MTVRAQRTQLEASDTTAMPSFAAQETLTSDTAVQGLHAVRRYTHDLTLDAVAVPSKQQHERQRRKRGCLPPRRRRRKASKNMRIRSLRTHFPVCFRPHQRALIL